MQHHLNVPPQLLTDSMAIAPNFLRLLHRDFRHMRNLQ